MRGCSTGCESAEQPAASAGGLWHLRDEGPRSTAAQPVGAGRCGTSGRRRHGWAIPTADGVTTRTAGPAGVRRVSTTCWRSRSPPVLRPQPRGVPTRWIEMVRHTLATARPQVLAGGWRDYVNELYAPAARSPPRHPGPGAAELAEWKRRLRRQCRSLGRACGDRRGRGHPGVGLPPSRCAPSGARGLDPSDVEVSWVSGPVEPPTS